MACRVGMATDPYERIEYWKRTEGHIYGAVLHSDLYYNQAIQLEKQEALERGCYSHPGGTFVGGPVWSVYVVSGGRIGT